MSNSTETPGPPIKAFGDLTSHDSTPTIPLTDVQKIRFSELAENLRDVRVQAYIEVNFGIQALKLLQTLVPLFVGL